MHATYACVQQQELSSLLILRSYLLGSRRLFYTRSCIHASPRGGQVEYIINADGETLAAMELTFTDEGTRPDGGHTEDEIAPGGRAVAVTAANKVRVEQQLACRARCIFACMQMFNCHLRRSGVAMFHHPQLEYLQALARHRLETAISAEMKLFLKGLRDMSAPRSSPAWPACSSLFPFRRSHILPPASAIPFLNVTSPRLSHSLSSCHHSSPQPHSFLHVTSHCL